MTDNKKEKRLCESWTKSYDSAIFGEHKLKFKVYEQNNRFIIQIENLLTDKVYEVKDKFDNYHDAVDWMGHIKNNLIDVNNQDLIDLIQ